MSFPKPGLLKKAKHVVKQARERQRRIINWLAPKAAEYIRNGEFIDESRLLARYYEETGESVTLQELRSANVITRGTYFTIIEGASSRELRKLIDDAWKALEKAKGNTLVQEMKNVQLTFFNGDEL